MSDPLEPLPASKLASRLWTLSGAAIAVFLAFGLAAKWLGLSFVPSSHTEDRTIHEIVIGNNVLTIPANAIRQPDARHNGLAERIDLYLHWPELEGYSQAFRDDFNHMVDTPSIIFLAFEKRVMPRDMSRRFKPVYSHLIEPIARAGPADIRFYDFREDTGYRDETLAVGEMAGIAPFVARCLTGPAADKSLAPCERDVEINDELIIVYRFPGNLLGEWRELDRAVKRRARDFLQTAKNNS